MARPETDVDAVRSKLLEVADALVRQRGAVDFTMTDLAREAGMSPSNVYRFFENKDALAEAMAGLWFDELIAIMEEVTAADLSAREKLFQFFARRLAVMTARFNEDPELFGSYMELGDEHFAVIRGYVDLGDHYMAGILAEALEEGHFAGLPLDEVVTMVNLMVQPFVNPNILMYMTGNATEQRLQLVIDTIFAGLKTADRPGATLTVAS